MFNIADVHLKRGEFAEALDYAERSLEISRDFQRQTGNEYYIATGYSFLGMIHRARGAYAQALHYLHDALDIVRAHNYGEPQLADASRNVGLVHYSQGDYRLAIDWYKRALRHNAWAANKRGAAQLLFDIGAAAQRLGQRQRADANYRESLAICEREQFADLAGAVLNARGVLALESGRLAEGRRLIADALERREALKDKAGTAEALNGLARVALARGKPEEALEFSRRAGTTAREIDHKELLSEAHTITGMAYRRLGNLAQARDAFAAAVDLIETMSDQIAVPDRAGARFFESKVSPYHELIELAVEGQQNARALELAERAKARVLARVVQRGRVEARSAMSAGDRLEEQRIRSRLLTLNQTIHAERLEAEPNQSRLARLATERDEQRRAYDSFLAGVYARNHQRRMVRGETAWFTMADADRILPDASAAILQYVVTDRSVLLFVLQRDPGGAPALGSYRVSGDAPSIARLARRFRDRIAARDLAFAEDARHLYDVLVNPARNRLRGRAHLIVVPDGALWDVPFQALRDAGGNDLIDSAAVSYAPSLTVLQELSHGKSQTDPPTLLAMGKSEFGAKGQAPALRLMSDLAPLPEAERQAATIARLYGPDRGRVYLGTSAQEDRFKAEAPRYSVLHLASHGLFDASSPLYSHVVLTPGSGASSEDGLLEAWELMELELKADLVVLSACETGRGQVAAGEGIVGTMWALLAAGAKSMVVSQWKVESTSTTSLMVALHRGVASGSGARAEHLRRAAREVKADPKYAHPFYWAPFILVGDPF
jgi:CHAT domain-containing protein